MGTACDPCPSASLPTPGLQLTADAEEAVSMDHYLRKTYCKTASLMANSCKASTAGAVWFA